MEQKETASAIDRERELEENIVALQERITFLEGEEKRLKECLAYEQSDVDAMEGRTLKSAFYTLIGKKDEKLDQEYREVDEAKAAYEAVVQELDEAKQGLKKADYALRSFRRQEKEKKQAMETAVKELRARIDALPSKLQTEFLYLEGALVRHAEQEKLILVAIDEGKKIPPLAQYVVEALQEAREYDYMDYYRAEYERRQEARERQEMVSLQSERFFNALQSIDLGKGACVLKNLVQKRNSKESGWIFLDWNDSTTARDMRIAIADLEALLDVHRREQEEIAARITEMLDEVGTP